MVLKNLLLSFNNKLSHDDAGRLLLRLTVGGLMLFHGLHKLFDGLTGIRSLYFLKDCLYYWHTVLSLGRSWLLASSFWAF
jgi:hypothetical protein